MSFQRNEYTKDWTMKYQTPDSFSSLFLNQIKVSLCMNGIGLGALNIVPREQIDRLLSIAGGHQPPTPSINMDLSEFQLVFHSLFTHLDAENRSKIAALKIYIVDGESTISSAVVAVPIEREGCPTTITEVLNSFAIKGKAVTAGVELMESTPVRFLREECLYADGFCHVVVFKK